VRDRDRPGEVGREDEGALEDRDEQKIAARVVANDLGSQLADAAGELLPGEIDLAGARLYVTRFRPYFSPSRSKSRRVKSFTLTSGYRSRNFRILRFFRVTSDCFITVTSR
jgi:hypothetical protein